MNTICLKIVLSTSCASTSSIAWLGSEARGTLRTTKRPAFKICLGGNVNIFGTFGLRRIKRSANFCRYCGSARGTGSPSVTIEMKRLGFLNVGSGYRETGGAPNVMQWMLLKLLTRELNADSTFIAVMCAYSKLAIVPPAEWPVNSNESQDPNSSRYFKRSATGFTRSRAAERKPAWQRLSSRSFGIGQQHPVRWEKMNTYKEASRARSLPFEIDHPVRPRHPSCSSNCENNDSSCMIDPNDFSDHCCRGNRNCGIVLFPIGTKGVIGCKGEQRNV